MFIWSFRMSKRELIIIAAGALVFAAVIVTVLLSSSGAAQSSVLLDSGYSLEAGNEEERSAFIKQFGWQTETEPVRVHEVRMPERLTDGLAEYNEMQLRQGFDLAELGGERVKLWSYRVTNYPGRVGEVLCDLIVLDGTVVGGGVRSAVKGGFSHGFDPTAFREEIAAAVSNDEVDRTVPDSIPEQSDVPPEADGDE